MANDPPLSMSVSCGGISKGVADSLVRHKQVDELRTDIVVVWVHHFDSGTVAMAQNAIWALEVHGAVLMVRVPCRGEFELSRQDDNGFGK